MTTRRSQTTYATIRTEGGLLPPDLLDRVLKLDSSLGGLQAADFQLPERSRLNTEISEAWQAIQTHFASFRRTMELVRREGGSGTTETRSWVQQVLRELGYRELRFVPAAETIDGRSFLISHRAGETDNAPPVHIVSHRQNLDERTGRTGGGEQRSPQALVQGYLNASDHLWGMVTNGLVFRLLRENRQIDRTLRVDFDLEGMLESESFAEFRLFWLVLHRSRFVQPGERRESAWLERWSQTAASEGTRALTGLRDGVERAIESLGQGLLSHPENGYLREQLTNGELTVDAYYSELLRLVYRLLFLLVAEERGLLFKADTGSRVIARYQKHYSIERLREEVARVRSRDPHHDDLWRGLLVTFDAMRFPREAQALGLEPLGGGLFGSGSCPHIADDAAPDTNGGDRIAGRPMLANAPLLDAIEALSEVTRDGITRRINYRDLDVEELGSVYEGLLEHRPALEATPNGGYRFGFSISTSRKETGSYYTPRSLVQELLNSALDPVIDAALERARTPNLQERALLDLNVCDPACGSGHFLLGAARRIGRRLAEVRAGADREPEPGDLRHATSEAIRHCIYGVDKNPLAIDLCKTALWIESHEPGGPIGFLDHHIKRGDSLVGVFDLDVLQEGIPDDAYRPVTGDERDVANGLKKRNTGERSKLTVLGNGRVAAMHNVGLFDEGEREDILKALATELDRIDAMPERTVADVQSKAQAYDRLQGRDDWQALSTACDLWTWAFFAPLTKETRHLVPTSGTVRQMVEKGNVPANITGKARAAAMDVGFFHWRLAFPDVFGTASRGGGFDAVLGNPPWEQVQPEEKKFFATRAPEIAEAEGAIRKRMIAALEKDDPALYEAWITFVQTVERSGKFMRQSGRYPLTARGKLNLYSLFAEHFRTMLAGVGRTGIIVPTGIATDATTAPFFNDLVLSRSLHSLYGFKNERFLFTGIEHTVTFALLTMCGTMDKSETMEFCWLAWTLEEMNDPARRVVLTPHDFTLLNPNTRTCPIFRNARDAELTKSIYRTASVLINEHLGEQGNPWGVTFRQGLFNMTSDSHLFLSREDLEKDGACAGADGHYSDGSLEWSPLYEAKLIHQYDHRFATYQPNGDTRYVNVEEHADANFVITPKYWVSKEHVNRDLRVRNRGWFLVYRTIARSTDVRTMISSVIPKAAVAGSAPLFLDLPADGRLGAALLANLNSMVFDFATRQKIGGTDIKFFHLKQLPMLSPDTYIQDLLKFIVPRVVELTYTAHDMEPFARDLGYDGEPFSWDEERRAKLRAELDGIYAHLYGISREDFAYILDTFFVLRDYDVSDYGEYRTKRLCLEAYDYLAPETLRSLELEIREIEGSLRRTLVTALDNDPTKLPSDIRAEIMEERAKQRAGVTADDDPSLRELLESAYLRHLDKIVRSEAVWPRLAGQFEPRKSFKSYFYDLNAFRNPLAHGRSVDEEVRRKGEEAIAWFRNRLMAGVPQ